MSGTHNEAANIDTNANQSRLIFGTVATMISLASLCVVLRFLSRKLTSVPLLLDDWLILVSLVSITFSFCIRILHLTN